MKTIDERELQKIIIGYIYKKNYRLIVKIIINF